MDIESGHLLCFSSGYFHESASFIPNCADVHVWCYSKTSSHGSWPPSTSRFPTGGWTTESAAACFQKSTPTCKVRGVICHHGAVPPPRSRGCRACVLTTHARHGVATDTLVWPTAVATPLDIATPRQTRSRCPSPARGAQGAHNRVSRSSFGTLHAVHVPPVRVVPEPGDGRRLGADADKLERERRLHVRHPLGVARVIPEDPRPARDPRPP